MQAAEGWWLGEGGLVICKAELLWVGKSPRWDSFLNKPGPGPGCPSLTQTCIQLNTKHCGAPIPQEGKIGEGSAPCGKL